MLNKKFIYIIWILFGCLMVTGCKQETVIPEYDYLVIMDTVGGSIGNYARRNICVMENSFLAEPGRRYSGSVKIPEAVKNVHHLLGWFRGTVNEDNEVIYGEKWDFDADRVTEDMTLYAKWERNYTVTLTYKDGDTEKNQLIYDSPTKDIVVARPNKAPTLTNYTFIEYYADEELTQVFEFDKVYDFVDEFGNEITDIKVYAKWISGNYKIVRTENDFATCYENTNFYFLTDVDMTGITVQFPLSYSGTIIGNGYTIKNLTIERQVNDVLSANAGLFGQITGGLISDVIFENCAVKVRMIKNFALKIGFLSGTATNCEIKNVAINNCKIEIISSGTYSNPWAIFGTKNETVIETDVTENNNEIIYTVES